MRRMRSARTIPSKPPTAAPWPSSVSPNGLLYVRLTLVAVVLGLLYITSCESRSSRPNVRGHWPSDLPADLGFARSPPIVYRAHGACSEVCRVLRKATMRNRLARALAAASAIIFASVFSGVAAGAQPKDNKELAE